ncbi:uncharacterized protein FIESC28_02110 [Fusarium coffeatum]|uniref:Uncharacterized protein n=1 Tax=Fusarium coffeatum TaxID=231269 RepID=A0A366S888_9HYPO|nr:uncharacterized protein FIESC28_02110 [Fusarium coffeatum]RBR25202.1 hypothetical protein FIESC28_02110 [Fusarium coffeatum]
MQSNLGQVRSAGQSSANRLPALTPKDQRNIDGVQSMLDEVKGLMVSLRCDAIPSSQQTGDEATHSGFDPEDRFRIGDLVKECQAVMDLSKDLDKDTELATLAYKTLETNSLADVQSGDDQQARHTLAMQVIRLLADSPDRFLAVLHSLGIRTGPEFDANMRLALGHLSPSQADVVMKETSRDELASLEKSHEEVSMRLKQAEAQVETLTQRLSSTEAERARLEGDRSDQAQKAEEQTRYAQRARSDLSRQFDRVAKLESALELEKLDKSRIQTELDEKNSNIAELQGSVNVLKQDNFEAHATNERLKRRSKEQSDEQAATVLSLQRKTEEAENNRVKAVNLESETASLQDNLRQCNAKLRETEKELAEAQIDLSESRGRLTSANQTSGESKERCRSLGGFVDELKKDLRELGQQLQDEQEKNSANRRSIQEKDTKIETLERGNLKLNNFIIAVKGNALEKMKELQVANSSQVEHAALLLRRLSIDQDSEEWNTVGKKVLTDSLTLANPVQWRPWDIVGSSSADESLSIRQHDRNANLIALDIMAILDVKEADSRHLLSYLQALQEALPGPSMIESIRQLIPDWFLRAVGDPRLHIMHMVAMCQIVSALVPERHESFEAAINAADRRVSQLAEALQAYDDDPTAGISLLESFLYKEERFNYY